MLDVQGRVEHHAVSRTSAATVWLDTEPGARAEPLLEYLDSMRFWSKVEPRDATAELAVLSRGRAGRRPAAGRAGRAGAGEPDEALDCPAAGSCAGCRGPVTTPPTCSCRAPTWWLVGVG